ncbi:hypothetical protein HHI36_016030 [Cryptolaemus montrouzieri]|uniref:Uncharacterized protein n=1 Tax=Cryptolaemus montrouzieri TaxID=559131 RepID=A0ABD2N796_9CUCU
MKMGVRSSLKLLTWVFCIYGTLAIPSSMVDEIKASELRPNKVKRVSLPSQGSEENQKSGNSHYHGNPTAIKRATELKNDEMEDVAPNDRDWTSDSNVYQNADNDFQSTLYNDDGLQYGRGRNDYEKDFQYGTNKEKLDEALENAVLKSELYGIGPTSINQYRYLENDKRKRRKRDSRKFNYGNRLSVDDLTPEEVLDLLTLYESRHQPHQKPDEDLEELEQDSDTWLDVPVDPQPEIGSRYILNENQPLFEKQQWSNDRSNRFLGARKRNDPTRELRYLTGPSKYDYYSLPQLLNNQREANVPVLHRYIL